jgi:hypothetical protein
MAAQRGRGLAAGDRRCCSELPPAPTPPLRMALTRDFTGAPPGTRTPNPRIKRGMIGVSGRPACTDSTRNRSGSTRYTGIWPALVPRPVPRPMASAPGCITGSHRSAGCRPSQAPGLQEVAATAIGVANGPSGCRSQQNPLTRTSRCWPGLSRAAPAGWRTCCKPAPGPGMHRTAGPDSQHPAVPVPVPIGPGRTGSQTTGGWPGPVRGGGTRMLLRQDHERAVASRDLSRRPQDSRWIRPG